MIVFELAVFARSRFCWVLLIAREGDLQFHGVKIRV